MATTEEGEAAGKHSSEELYEDLREPEIHALWGTLANDDIKLAEIAEPLDVSRATISNYRSTLVEKGYLVNLKPGRGLSDYIPGERLTDSWESYETEETEIEDRQEKDGESENTDLLDLGRELLGDGNVEGLEQEENPGIESREVSVGEDIEQGKEISYSDSSSSNSYNAVPHIIDSEEEYAEIMELFDSIHDDSRSIEGTDIVEENELLDESNEIEEEPGMHKDNVFDLLKNGRRRAVLRYIDEFSDETPVPLGDLSEEITAYEYDKAVQEIDSDERKRVYVALYQTHLDKLDEEDLVDFNKDRGLIEHGPDFDLATQYLEDEFRADTQRVYRNEGFFSKILDKLPF